jgi:hypothetical protein
MNTHLLSSQNAIQSCRICLDDDNPTDLIRPCLCRGGSAYVHRKCLDNWRSMNKLGRAFKSCDVCRFEYIIEPIIDNPSADRRRLLMYRLLVTRDITLLILLVQAIIIGMTFLLQVADKKNNTIKKLYPTSMSSFGVYYLSSVILFFALLGLFSLIVLCCGSETNNDQRCDCACYSCCCLGSDCNGCDDDSAGVIIIVIVILFAILGVFVAIILSGITIGNIMQRHTKKLWLRQETKKYIVKDLQGRANEVTNRLTQDPMINSTINMEIDNYSTLKTLSTTHNT